MWNLAELLPKVPLIVLHADLNALGEVTGLRNGSEEVGLNQAQVIQLWNGGCAGLGALRIQKYLEQHDRLQTVALAALALGHIVGQKKLPGVFPLTLGCTIVSSLFWRMLSSIKMCWIVESNGSIHSGFPPIMVYVFCAHLLRWWWLRAVRSWYRNYLPEGSTLPHSRDLTKYGYIIQNEHIIHAHRISGQD